MKADCRLCGKPMKQLPRISAFPVLYFCANPECRNGGKLIVDPRTEDASAMNEGLNVEI